ncbi:MAG: response regulator [Campylobacterales bacterium]|nr:response regulator [Campylobacterales bacterium]
MVQEEKILKIYEIAKELQLLYVEDNESVRLTNTDLFGNFFNRIDVATNGLEGLEKFTQNRYDIIITDINMPKMNGIEMIERIRKIDKEVAILIVSAYSDIEYLIHSIKVGIQGYVVKPTSIEQLVDALQNTMNHILDRQSKEAYERSLKNQVDSESKKRQETEVLLMQQSKMASMGEMIGNIAHQWRQPLNELGLLIQSFKSAYERGMMDAEFIDNRVTKGVLLIEKMSNTIENFRNFYSPSKNKTNFSLIDSIYKSLAIFEGAFRNNDIELLFEHGSREDYSFYGFSDEFEQVFVNLLSNAKDSLVEYNRYERIISIHVKNIDDFIEIEVCDNGLGLSDEVQQKLFEPYFTTKEESKGTGIGLYMSKEIVDKHLKGTIEAYNKTFHIKDKSYSGAAFKITLPHTKEFEDEQ